MFKESRLFEGTKGLVYQIFDFLDICEKDEVGNPKDSKPVDQFFSQEFNRAENGFPRSDVECFLHAESEELKAQIASRMQEIVSKYSNQELSDETLAKMVIPRWVQSAVDLREWSSQIDELGFAKAVDKYVAEQQAKQAANKPDSNVIDFTENQSNETGE